MFDAYDQPANNPGTPQYKGRRYDFYVGQYIALPDHHWVTLRYWECRNCRPAKRLLNEKVCTA
jgi:hypothetical protein